MILGIWGKVMARELSVGDEVIAYLKTKSKTREIILW